MTQSPNDWKDGEVLYCAELVRTHGNYNVPAESVASYLALQCADAILQGADEAAASLAGLAIRWRSICEVQS